MLMPLKATMSAYDLRAEVERTLFEAGVFKDVIMYPGARDWWTTGPITDVVWREGASQETKSAAQKALRANPRLAAGTGVGGNSVAVAELTFEVRGNFARRS